MELSRYFTLWNFITQVLSSGSKEPLISIKAGRERIRKYEIIRPVVSVKRNQNQPYPQQIAVNITNSSCTYQLEFQLNQNFQSKSFVSIMVDANNNQVVDKHDYPNCYYSGTVKGHPEWTASLTACHGLQAEFGNAEDKKNYFHLEPLSKTDTSMDQMHAFYKHSEYSTKDKKYGCKSGANHKHTENRTSQRRALPTQTQYVEFVAVNDDAQFAAFGRNVTATVQRTLSIANGMNNLFIRGFDIRVILTMVITFTAGNPFTASPNASTLLDSFELYANNASGLGNILRDNIMLFTGLTLADSTIGLAYIGTMCSSLSIGLSQDGGMPLDMVISTATHEMGHNFNMLHDDGRDCKCPDEVCIMAAASATIDPVHFSDCSASDLSLITDKLSCLLNVPTIVQGGTRCGNGLVEDGEACDCGEAGFCTNPCCNANTCQLTTGAQCAYGTCCNTSTCQLLASGTVCRIGTGECDITEYCTGSSSKCPQDVFRMNGSPCALNTGYCYNGGCPTHRAQCMAAWNTTEGTICYRYNVDGDFSANCGTTLTGYLPCSERNIFCGQLQCRGGTFQQIYDTSGFTISYQLGDITCNSYGVEPSSGIANPGLVNDGTRCDTNKLCISQECRNLSTLNISSCPVGRNGQVCSGSTLGACNHRGLCSCLPGYTGETCDLEVDVPPLITAEAMMIETTPTTEKTSTAFTLTNAQVAISFLVSCNNPGY